MTETPAQMSEYAKLADAAYRPAAERATNVNSDWRIDPEYNHDNHFVVHNTRDNRSVLVHRGTKKTELEDYLSDLAIITHKEDTNERFQKAQQLGKELLQRYSNRNLITVGHSLGGKLANSVGQSLGIESHSFNPGAAPDDFVNRQQNRTVNNKHHVYIVPGDVLSNGAYGWNNVNIHTVGRNVKEDKDSVSAYHSVRNFYHETGKKSGIDWQQVFRDFGQTVSALS